MSFYDCPSPIDFDIISKVFDQAYHNSEDSVEPVIWRINNRIKTVNGLLVLCLNIGVEPPDVKKFSPYSTLECWIDPASLCPHEALRMIGSLLQDQYIKCQPKAKYKQCLDPTIDDIKRFCLSLRKNAKEERILFHYNGHGVPNPTNNGELWVFNKNYTQYIPFSITDLRKCLASPTIYVFDCSNAGTIINQNLKLYEAEKSSQQTSSTPLQVSNMTDQFNLTYGSDIYLGASKCNELLSFNPHIPADVFTSCLTTPIKMAVKWHILRNSTGLFDNEDLSLVDKIPGNLSDRHTLLGELNWIYTAITDSIAWNSLPKDLFQMLYRQDLLVACLFRNFLLAQRIMQKYGNTPVSFPKLPQTTDHELWSAWDLVLDQTLIRLRKFLKEEYGVREEINLHNFKRLQESQKLQELKDVEIREMKDLIEKRDGISIQLKEKLPRVKKNRMKNLKKRPIACKITREYDDDDHHPAATATTTIVHELPPPIKQQQPHNTSADLSQLPKPVIINPPKQPLVVVPPLPPSSKTAVFVVSNGEEVEVTGRTSADHLFVGILPCDSTSPLSQHSPPAPVVNAILSSHPKLKALLTEISGYCQSFFSRQLSTFQARLIAHKEIRGDGKSVNYYYDGYGTSSYSLLPPPYYNYTTSSTPTINARSLTDSYLSTNLSPSSPFTQPRIHQLEMVKASSELLPIVLQVLLSLNHRVKALDLLGKYLDIGPRAVNQALSVGIFPYTLRLLQSPWKEMKPLLIYVWAKILSVDNTCQADLIKENGHKYFIAVLHDNGTPIEYRTMAAFCISSLIYRYPLGQEACMQENLISICLELLVDTQNDLTRSLINIMPDIKIRREYVFKQRCFRFWLIICLSCIWRKFEPARWRAIRDSAHEKLKPLLRDTSISFLNQGLFRVTSSNTALSSLFTSPAVLLQQQQKQPQLVSSTLNKSLPSSSSSSDNKGIKKEKESLHLSNSIKIEYEYYTDGPDIRAAAVFALGNLISGSSVHSDHSVSVDHSIARDLMSETSQGLLSGSLSNTPVTSNAMVVRDGSHSVRKELVVAIQNLVTSYENHFLTLVGKLQDESKHMAATNTLIKETNNPTSTISATGKKASFDTHYLTESSKFSGMNKILSSSSAALNTISSNLQYSTLGPFTGINFQQQTSGVSLMLGTSSLTGMPGGGLINSTNNIYYMIWKTLLTLSQDPHIEVSHNAKIVLNNVKKKVWQISFKRDVSTTSVPKLLNSGKSPSISSSDDKGQSSSQSVIASSSSQGKFNANPNAETGSAERQRLNIFNNNHVPPPIATTGAVVEGATPLIPTTNGEGAVPSSNVIMLPLVLPGPGGTTSLSPDYTYAFSRSRKIFDKGPSLITQDTFSEETLNEESEIGLNPLHGSASDNALTTSGPSNSASAPFNKLFPSAYLRVFSTCVIEARHNFWDQMDWFNSDKENFYREFDKSARTLKYGANNEALAESRRFFNAKKSTTTAVTTSTIAASFSTTPANYWMPKFEYEAGLPKFTYKPICIKFFPYHPLIAVADIKNNVSIWNTDNQQMLCNFVNCPSNDTRIINLEILNDYDIYPLLCIGSSDGSIRIWKNLFDPRQYLPNVSYFSPTPILSPSGSSSSGFAGTLKKQYHRGTSPSFIDRASSIIESHGIGGSGQDTSGTTCTPPNAPSTTDNSSYTQQTFQPTLLTAWLSLSDFNVSRFKNANLKLCWDQMLNYLYVSGDTKIIRVWDIQSQSRLYDIYHKSEYSLTSMATSPYQNYLLANGFSDGTIKVYDIRTPLANPVKTYKENNSPVLKIGFYQGSTADNMITISYNGEIKLWNLTSPSLTSFKTSKFSNTVSSVDIHSLSTIVAGGLSNQTVGIYNPRGYVMNSLKSPSWFMSQKSSPVSTIAFHPYKFAFASCTDNLVSFYGISTSITQTSTLNQTQSGR